MYSFRFLFCCLMWVLMWLPAFGQYHALSFEKPEYLNRQLTVYQYSAIQDQEGFIWMGGSEGIVRYDGYTVTPFTFDSDDTTSLPSNEIRKIIETPDGGIWVATAFGGLCRFNKLTESFERFNTQKYGEQGWLSDEIWEVYLYRDSLLMIGTGVGLSLLEYKPLVEEGRVICHSISLHPGQRQEEENPIPFSMLEDRVGNLWVGGNFGLIRIPRGDLLSGKMLTTEYEPWIENKRVLDLEIGSNADLWVATDSGLVRIPRLALASEKPEGLNWFFHAPSDPLSLGSNSLSTLLYDSKGDLWIGSIDAGISILSADEMGNVGAKSIRFRNYKNDPLDPNSISANQVKEIFEDRTQNIWICTYHLLNKVYQLRGQFNHTFASFSYLNRIWDNTVFAIYHDPQDNTWIGTKAGLSKFNHTTREVSLVKTDYRETSNPKKNALRSIIPYGPDSLLVTSLSGLWVFNIQTSQFSRFAGVSEAARQLFETRLYHTIQDQAGNFWIASRIGLCRLNPRTAEVRQYLHDPAEPTSLIHDYVRFLFEDPAGNLWIGTEKGLDRLPLEMINADHPQFDHYYHVPGHTNSLSNNEIRWVTKGEEGTLWIGTDGGGINHLWPETGACKRYSQKDGLRNDVIYAILPDKVGNLWISTNMGISKFDIQTEQFTNYDVTDGLQENEFNVRAAYRTPEGELFFGGINGFNHFFPEDIIPNQFAPTVRITGLRIRNEPVDFRTSDLLSQPITFTDKLELDWRDDIFSLEVAAMEFSASQQNQYKYKMEGLYDDWIPLGNENKITFTGLNPGSYTLKVLGSNNDGVWSEEAATLDIRIRPPFWQTWWAYLLYVALFLSLVGWVVRIRIKRLRLENALVVEKVESEKLREIQRVKSDFLANVSHELRTPLTLIAGPVSSLYQRTSHPESKELLQLIQDNSERLHRMINQLLEAARIEADKQELALGPVNLTEFFAMISRNFKLIAAEKEIELVLSAPTAELGLICDQEKLEHIFYNLVSNAVKFTPTQGKIQLSWKASGTESVEIIVSDNGPGIPKQDLPHLFNRFYQARASGQEVRKGTGLGLALVRDLVRLHTGTVRVESEKGVGTQFIVTLPRVGPVLTPKIVETLKEERATEAVEIVRAETAKTPRTEHSEKELPTVLIIEDNSDLRKFIKMEISDRFETLEAVNGEMGLKMAQEFVPDLVITDWMMPKMDGTTFCKQLKSAMATSHIPVIMLTARSSDESRILGLEAGADDYLTKPFNSQELRLRIGNMLRFRDRLRAQFQGEVIEISQVQVGVPAEDEFLTQIKTIIESHIDDPEFLVEDLARGIGLGQKQLQRKLKAIAGQSPNQFIRNVRLDSACKLLVDLSLSVSEVGYKVGFSSPSYFTKCFQERFGNSPKVWRSEVGKDTSTP